MSNFLQIAGNVDVLPLLLEIYRQPELWNQHTARTGPGGPHSGIADIWCRFRRIDELTSVESYAEPHTPVNYPAWHALPHLRPIVMGMMARVEGVQLGGVLITKVPAGKQVAPHDDRGRWHAEFFNTKVYLPLASNDKCFNTCEDERIVMPIGTVYLFDNLKVHSTVNEGATDRITLIVSMRCES